MQNHLELIVPATLDLSHMVRETSKEIFKWMGFSPREISQWELITDELFMNAVEYGSKPEMATVYLSYKKTEDGGLFQIEDEGNGPKKIDAQGLKELIQKRQKEAKLTDTSGRGLALIMEKWTDSHTIEQSPKGGILIRIEKKHNNEPSPNTLETSPPILPKHPPSKVIVVNENVGKPEISNYIKTIQEAVNAIEANEVIELNFKQVKYINSIFIGYLANWYNQAKAKQSFLILSHLNKEIKEILNLVGLNKIFNLNI